MANELAVTNGLNVAELGRMGKMLALSGYFDQDRNIEAAIAQMAVKVMAGREMGFGPFASANGIHIISGKPAVSANLMAAAVKSHPSYDFRVRTNTNEAVEIEFFQNGESLGVSSFTMEDAKAANLVGNKTWQKFPRNMLFARAMSNGVRWFTPDVFAGNAVYVPEELGADVDGDGNVVAVHAAPVIVQESPKQQAPQQNGNDLPTSLDDVPEVPFDAGAAGTPFDDVPDKVDDKTLKAFNTVGRKMYAAGWDDKRHEIVAAKTRQRTTSSRDLYQAEAEELIESISKRLNEQAQEVAA